MRPKKIAAVISANVARGVAEDRMTAAVQKLFPIGTIVHLRTRRMNNYNFIHGTVMCNDCGRGYYNGNIIVRNNKTGKTRRVSTAYEISAGNLVIAT